MNRLRQPVVPASIAAVGTIALATFQYVMGVPMGFLRSPTVVAAAVLVLLCMALASTLHVRSPEASFVCSAALMAILVLQTRVPEFNATPIWWLAITKISSSRNGGRLSLLATVGFLTTTAVGAVAAHAYSLTAILQVAANAAVMFVVFVILGRALGWSRSRSQQQLRTAQAVHDAQLTSSLLDVRRDIARELHDVAAFHLTGMLVQARAAQAVMARDGEQAKALTAEAINQGQLSFDSLRRIVEVLRYEDDSVPHPTIASIATLIDYATPSLPNIQFFMPDVTQFDDVSSVTHLAAYRIVQESIANALRHARDSAVMVHVYLEDGCVEIRVHNSTTRQSVCDATSFDPPHNYFSEESSGWGLAGMRERAALVGGKLRAGPDDAGGWLVHASLPSRGLAAPTFETTHFTRQ